MTIQWVGLVASMATFFGIWFGHVAVRKIEAAAPKLWLPVVVSLVLGLSLETWSLISKHQLLSAVTGILGITLLWDAFEFWRQEQRIRKGHAPANPNNPRHARILAESKAATTLDLLARDPVGRPVTTEEATQMVTRIKR